MCHLWTFCLFANMVFDDLIFQVKFLASRSRREELIREGWRFGHRPPEAYAPHTTTRTMLCQQLFRVYRSFAGGQPTDRVSLDSSYSGGACSMRPQRRNRFNSQDTGFTELLYWITPACKRIAFFFTAEHLGKRVTW